MNDFNPGDGWREVDSRIGDTDTEEVRHWDGGVWRYWVREEPVPPLPTEPYTVIRVFGSKFEPNGSLLVRLEDGSWWAVKGGAYWAKGDSLKCDRFEVLAEPLSRVGEVAIAAREDAARQTAKAVLDRTKSLYLNTLDDWPIITAKVAREYGVES